MIVVVEVELNHLVRCILNSEHKLRTQIDAIVTDLESGASDRDSTTPTI